MKILAAADIHGNHAVYAWLLQRARARRVDCIVLAGDLLGCPDDHDSVEAAQRHDAAQTVSILQGSPAPIYYIMGNDDLVELDPPAGSLTSIHGRRVDLPGVNLVGYQYSLPFMGGIYEKPEPGIREDLDAMERLVDSETVLVTHSPAFGILDRGILDMHAGSHAILDVVRSRNPRAHIHGHVHAWFGREGCHFNVAAAGQHKAMCIDLDTLTHTVESESAA